jgi:hypothetical protein
LKDDAEGRRREIVRAGTADSATIEVLRGGKFARWRIEVRGPARLEGDLVEIPKGAAIEAFDAKGERKLTASARRVRIEVGRTRRGLEPRLVEGLDGVEAASDTHKVRAERLRYRPGSDEVEVLGNGRVEAEGWPRDVTFGRLVFVLVEDDGIDLRRASSVEVGGR